MTIAPKRHWTPRYIADRTRWSLYQRRNPDKPWLNPTAISLLDMLLQPFDRGIEWGSGRSTVWFAKHLSHLTSVEDNAEWHAIVKRQLNVANVTNVDYRLTEPSGSSPDSDYVRIVDEFADGSLGFALVDGASSDARGHCANAVIPKLAPCGLLVVDNVNWFLDHETHSPSSRYGLGPANEIWAALQQRVKGWRMMWTTSGVTDAAIWIKPSN